MSVRNKLLVLLIIVLAFSVFGCRKPDPVPTPLPKDYIEIPAFIVSPDRIEYWHRLKESKWVSDKEIFGYEDYRVTPVEFTLSEVPDVNNPGRIIKKIPFRDDCDGFANFNPYVAYAALGYDCYVVFILNLGNIHNAHAISYGWEEAEKLNCHVWDNQLYRGKWSNIQAYISAQYPNWIIYHHVTLQEELTELFKKGHLEYASVEPKSRKLPKKQIVCENGFCELR